MKKIILTLFAILLFGMVVNAQINLVGASSNPNGTIDIVKWQALDSTSVSRYPSGLQGYLYASSVFDSYNSNYYLGGISSGSGVLLSFNTSSNTPNLIPYATLSNISEIDMSTGKIYKLRLASVGYISVNEYDIATGSEIVLGVITEPGVNGIITDAISFDSNNGILYYVGYDDSPASCLYGIPVRNPVFSWTKTTLLTTAPGNNFSSVNYDNGNNILFAMNAEYNSGGSYTGNKVVEINTTSGEVIERGVLVGFQYYLGGSSSFDQNTGSFLLVGFDAAFNEKMIVFNILDNTFITGFVPDNVSEIICDNYSFARNTYMATSVGEAIKEDFTIFPNPVADRLNISCKNNFTRIEIIDMHGQIHLSSKLDESTTQIPVSTLPAGIYICHLTGTGLNARYGRMVKQ